MIVADRLHSWRRLAGVAAVCLLTIGLTGCPWDESKVRVLNASRDYAAIDLRVDDETKLSSIAYATVSDYLGLDADTYTFKLISSGSATSLASVSETLSKNKHRTVVAYGPTGSLSTVDIDEDQDDADSGEASLLVLNTATDAGAVDIYLTGTDDVLSEASPVASDVATAATGEDYITVASGTFRLRITAAGSTSDVRLDLPSFTLGSTQVGALIVTDTAGGVLVNALFLPQQGKLAVKNNTQARVRAVVGMNNGKGATVGLGETNLLTGAYASTIGAYKLVDAGTQTAAVSIDANAVGIADQSLVAGLDYTFLIWNNTSGTQATLLSDDNRLPRSDDGVKVRLVHAMSGLSDPIALAVDFSPVAQNVAQGTSSTATEITSTTDSRLDVTNSSTTATLFTLSDTSLLSAGVYTMFMFGETSAATGILRKDR